MRQVDEVLADERLVELVYEAWRAAGRTAAPAGASGTPADVVLRLLVLKHVRNWSYAVLEREVRANLVYRQFTRVGAGKVPDAKTLGRLGIALGPAVIEQIHQRVVAIAQEQKVVQGRRMRVDTTVVETNIHYPTDASLLGDGVRVLTRTMKRITELAGAAGAKLRDRTRSTQPLPDADRPRRAQPRRAGQAAHAAVLPQADGHHRPGRRSGQALRREVGDGHQAQRRRCSSRWLSRAIAPYLETMIAAGAAGDASNPRAHRPRQHPRAGQDRQPVRARTPRSSARARPASPPSSARWSRSRRPSSRS